MINKEVATVTEAVAGIQDGAVLLVGGFGNSGRPAELLTGVLELGAKELTIVASNATAGEAVVAELKKAGRIRKVRCSFPRGLSGKTIFRELSLARADDRRDGKEGGHEWKAGG